jgi:hypothetical protein
MFVVAAGVLIAGLIVGVAALGIAMMVEQESKGIWLVLIALIAMIVVFVIAAHHGAPVDVAPVG